MIKMSKSAFLGKCRFKLLEKIDFKIFKEMRKKKLKDKDFSIVSNNCYGGWVYRYFNLPYNTPTVGLFIMPDDYIKLIYNLDYYFKNCKMSFINPENSKYKNEIIKIDSRFGKYPIGLLDDIEIHFLHYNSKKEALECWNRRLKRFNWNNIIVKFSEQNNSTIEHIKSFSKLKKYKKICFVAHKNFKLSSDIIYVKEYKKDGFMVDDTWFSNKYVNLVKFLNK